MKPAPFRIGTHTIGDGRSVFVIAEAGVNHNGRLDLALKLVDAAAKAGADAVKFQTFKAEQLSSKAGEMAEYQKKNIGKTESQVEMLRKLELREAFYKPIMKRCAEKKILFLSTPHGGFESVDFLVKLKVKALKFGSGDLTNLPVLSYAAKFKLPMILGTGMATFREVQDAVRVIQRAGNKKIVMLHCTTNYPCPFDEVDLRAMQTMMTKLPVFVGYSDHTEGIQVPTMAATLGACLIEKHFTLDRSMPGPDHKASLEPDELAAMVQAILRVPIILGSAEKRPHASERDVTTIARKSLVSLRKIQKGECFTLENLGIKRPGNGLSPSLFDRVLGRPATRAIQADVPLRRGDVSL